MELSSSLQVLQLLLKGVDPTSGEIVDADHLIRDDMVVSALNAACLALQNSTRHAKPTAPRNPAIPKDGSPWTPEEDFALRDAVSGMTPDEIAIALDDVASRHQRKPSAIASRLAHLGIIDSRLDVLHGASVTA